MSFAVSKKNISRSFSRHAGEYNRHAIVQKRVVTRLEELIVKHFPESPARMLDIGCGTGALLAALQARYPHAQGCGLDLSPAMADRAAGLLAGRAAVVNGDVERLPFRDGSFDLVASASTFQWVHSLETSFSECFRVLDKGGVMCAAFFGGNTLWELHESYRRASARIADSSADPASRLHRFKGMPEVCQALSSSGFDRVVVATETEVEWHRDVTALLRSIKGIGAATTVSSATGGGLGWRRLLNAMAENYEAHFRSNGQIPATYEVIYIIARRGSAQ